MNFSRRRHKKAIDMRDSNVLSSDSAFAQSAKALLKALEIAEYTKDIDAIVAISDRWAVLARTLELNNLESDKMPMGFVFDREREDENDNS
jgi:hypothetical protein